MKESDIQNTICEWLTLKRFFFWRQNTIPGVFTKDGKMQFRRLSKYAIRGVPDIILIHPGRAGRFVGLEVKMPNGRVSIDQEKFGYECRRAGGDYYIVHSLEEAIDLLK